MILHLYLTVVSWQIQKWQMGKKHSITLLEPIRLDHSNFVWWFIRTDQTLCRKLVWRFSSAKPPSLSSRDCIITFSLAASLPVRLDIFFLTLRVSWRRETLTKMKKKVILKNCDKKWKEKVILKNCDTTALSLCSASISLIWRCQQAR